VTSKNLARLAEKPKTCRSILERQEETKIPTFMHEPAQKYV
jgi:hypothetical protein